MTQKKAAQKTYNEKMLTEADIESGIRLLNKRLAELKSLSKLELAYDSAPVVKMQLKLNETVTTIYGPSSRKIEEIPNLQFPVRHYMGAEKEERQSEFIEHLPKAIGWIESHIESFEEQLEEQTPKQPNDPDIWVLIHPAIKKLCKKKYDDGHCADSVFTGVKAVNERVKAHVKKQTGKELDGVPLMQQAFSPNDPKVVLADVTTMSGKDEQAGYMSIFAGAMQGIRNPKAHGNLTISNRRAMHLLFLASLLMHRLDDAGVACDV
jgi:uncharacterized protein (TIGR02391 family)